MSLEEYMDIDSLLQQNDPDRKALFEVLFGSDTELSGRELEKMEEDILKSASRPRPAGTMFLNEALSELMRKTRQPQETQKDDSVAEIRQLLSEELGLGLSKEGLLIQTEQYITEEDCPALPSMKEFGARKQPPFSAKIERSSGEARAHADSSSIYVSAESACTGDRAMATAALGFTITPRYDISGDIRIRAHLFGNASQRETTRGPGVPDEYETRAWIELKAVRLVGDPPIFMTPLGTETKRLYMDYGLRKAIPSTIEAVVRPMFNRPGRNNRSKLSVLITAHVEALAPASDCEEGRDKLEDFIKCLHDENIPECPPPKPEELPATASAEINLAVCGVDVMYQPTINPPWDNSAVADVRRRLLELEKGLRRLDSIRV